MTIVAAGDITADDVQQIAGHLKARVAGEGLTAGHVGYFNLLTGKVYQSDTGTANDIRANCIILQTVSTDDPVQVQTGGKYVTSGLTANDVYYLGASGAISTTQSGVRIGFATSTTVLQLDFFQDDRDMIGTIKSYHLSMTGIPANNKTAFWAICNGATVSDTESPLNGQVLPLMDGSSGSKRFLRGSTTSGTTGGAETHNHQWYRNSGNGSAEAFSVGTNNAGTYDSSGGNMDIQDSGGSQYTTDSYTSNSSSLPSYFEVVFLIKIK